MMELGAGELEVALTAEEEEEFRRELEAVDDTATCSESDSEDFDAATYGRRDDTASSSEDEEDYEYSSDFSASINNLKSVFRKREEKLSEYEEVLCTLSENIRDSTAKLNPRQGTAEGGSAGSGKAAADLAVAVAEISEKENHPSATDQEAVKDVKLSEEMREEAASREDAARKFKLVEQERERQREKQRIERERKAEDERKRQEAESKIAMAKLEEESRARLKAIEESFEKASKELEMEVEQEKFERETIEKEAEEQMNNLQILQQEEEKRKEERSKRLQSYQDERRKIALDQLQDKQAARTIQKHYACFRRRKGAAIKIQTLLRCSKAKAEAREKRQVCSSAITIQKWVKAHQAKDLFNKHRKARCIQKHVKKHFARQKFRRTLSSVVVIQRFARMLIERSKYLHTLQRVVCIQSHVRMFHERQNFRRHVNAARVIRNAWLKHSNAKHHSQELASRVVKVAKCGSLEDMYGILKQMTTSVQNRRKVIKQLQEGIKQRCDCLVKRVVSITKHAVGTVNKGRRPTLPLFDENVRSEAIRLGMQSLLGRFESIENAFTSLGDGCNKSQAAGVRLLTAIGQKSDPDKLEDLAYKWSMESIAQSEADMYKSVFWTQAYQMMSLRQEDYISQSGPVGEKVKALQSLARSARQPQPNDQIGQYEINDLTKDMLMLNSPGIELQKIQELDLSLEGLTSMKEIGTCKSLKKLCLNANFIKSLDGIEHCSMLEELSMKGNALSVAGGLSSLSKVKKLHLDGNYISSVDCISNMKELQCLTANDNRVERFVCKKASQLSIKSLSLAGNKIKQLESICDLASLQNLNLSRNQIEQIDGLERCQQLKDLDLSNNYIGSISCIARMETLTNLTELRLSRNRLAAFPLASLHLPMLRSLYLEENSIVKIEPALGCPLLERLELGFNELTNLDDIASLSCCQRLQFLNLSENPVASNDLFAKTVRKLLPSLIELNNEAVEERQGNKFSYQLGTAYVKWNCVQRLKPDLILNYKSSLWSRRDCMECAFSNHTLTAKHTPVVGCFADSNLKKMETWRSAINQQWNTNTANACRLTNIDCREQVEKYQNVFIESANFYSEYESIANAKASLIQKTWRTFKARRQAFRESSECRETAARIVQRAWQNFRLRKTREFTEAKEKLEKLKTARGMELDLVRHLAAQKIQAVWRGFKVKSFIMKARENSKYVDEDDLSDLEDFDEDFLKDFDAEADQYLSSAVAASPVVASSRPGAAQKLQSINGWTSERVSQTTQLSDNIVSSTFLTSQIPENEDPSPQKPMASESVPSSSNSPHIENNPSPSPARKGLPSNENSFASPRRRLEASESTLSLKQERSVKQKAKMEEIANEWGFKDQTTAAMFMKKRNKMVRQQKKKKNQQKMKNPSVRYQKFREATEGRAPLKNQSPSHHRNGKSLALARTALYGPASRGNNKEASPSENKGVRPLRRERSRPHVDDDVSTISMASDETMGDPHSIAMDYLQVQSSRLVNNWSM